MGSHQSARMVTDQWLTPPQIIEALGPFDLDPCAPSAWPTEDWPHAKHCISLPLDGLAMPWTKTNIFTGDVDSHRVWLNPPYSRKAVAWLRKMAKHRFGTALVFARTETSWFREYVWRTASAVLFLDGRLHFYRPDGTRAEANAGAPSALVAYGAYDAFRLQTSGLTGTHVHGFQWLPGWRAA